MIKEYSKQQMLGYLIMSLANMGKSKEDIRAIIRNVDENMEVWTEDYAEGIYDNFYAI